MPYFDLARSKKTKSLFTETVEGGPLCHRLAEIRSHEFCKGIEDLHWFEAAGIEKGFVMVAAFL